MSAEQRLARARGAQKDAIARFQRIHSDRRSLLSSYQATCASCTHPSREFFLARWRNAVDREYDDVRDAYIAANIEYYRAVKWLQFVRPGYRPEFRYTKPATARAAAAVAKKARGARVAARQRRMISRRLADHNKAGPMDHARGCMPQ